MNKKGIIIIDAENMILGRLASIAAKRLLEGETIFIINAEKAVISGNPKSIFEEYKKTLNLRTLRNPGRGPKKHKSPNNILRNTIKNMLPKDNSKGRNALHRLRVFIGSPEKYKNYPTIKFEEADAKNLSYKYVYLIDISKQLGWRG